MPSFLVLQLADAAFPSGGYAHSAGLEACAGLADLDLDAFVTGTLRNAARSTLPFVRDARRAPATLGALDVLADATITSHVANRASRAQGRAFASTAARVFLGLDAVAAHAKTGPAHHAPVFGAIFGLLGVAEPDTLAAYQHGVLRGVLSSAVRLGLVGPIEAQRMHAAHAATLDALAASVGPALQAAQTDPILELYGALHDELDGRLFQS